jgi:hypothetical protein
VVEPTNVRGLVVPIDLASGGIAVPRELQLGVPGLRDLRQVRRGKPGVDEPRFGVVVFETVQVAVDLTADEGR